MNSTTTYSTGQTEAALIARALKADPARCSELAAAYGSIRNVPDKELRTLRLTRDRIDAVAELAAHYAAPVDRMPDSLRNSADIFARLQVQLANLSVEHFLVLLMDNKHRVMQELTVSVGSLTQAIIHPRDVYKPVILSSAAAIVLVHNHPSGDPTPSQEDIAITRRLREVGDLVGVRVLDHVIIGRGSYVSMVEGGYW